ncbi:flagellar protein FlaG [Pelosinus sp. UFO1]|uniref:flagellar protein FlaG n=1 Tax=Pelosinus sp. UFO1 TaxID=484770 RepID=UPI0004D1CE41|nr:flagellar protein FlaG [Pelosinus sp. UFO1]AIF53654.1 flagellar protein FlaG protein [Pelosinus sp. UFO1]
MKIDKVNSTGTIQNTENTTKDQEMNATQVLDVIDSHQLKQAVDKLNKKAEETNYDVQFAVYKDTNRIIVQVVDKTTKEVISTFPPKQILEMARMVDQDFKIFDKKI